MTDNNIKALILPAVERAAEYIKTHPDEYAFMECEVRHKGEPMCMLGHVGAQLGLAFRTDVDVVAPLLGFSEPIDFYKKYEHLGCLLSPQDSAQMLETAARDLKEAL